MGLMSSVVYLEGLVSVVHGSSFIKARRSCQVTSLHDPHVEALFGRDLLGIRGFWGHLPFLLTTPLNYKRPNACRYGCGSRVIVMSGAQGALPKEARTATIYESVEGGENKRKMELCSREDQGVIRVDKLEEKVEDPTGDAGPIFGSPKDDDDDKNNKKEQDLGVTGTA